MWQFASPANRAATGPLERFGQMLKDERAGYAPLLGHKHAEVLRTAQVSATKHVQARRGF